VYGVYVSIKNNKKIIQTHSFMYINYGYIGRISVEKLICSVSKESMTLISTVRGPNNQ
jgi:hypothetical protein